MSDKIRKIKLLKLKSSIYGLKISSKNLNKKFTAEIKKLGLENDINEPCLFTWRFKDLIKILVIYVDDLLIAGNCLDKINQIIEKFCEIFRIINLGEPKIFLGL